MANTVLKSLYVVESMEDYYLIEAPDVVLQALRGAGEARVGDYYTDGAAWEITGGDIGSIQRGGWRF